MYYDGGDDAIALKSGLCDAGSRFDTPTANVRVQHVVARTRDACFCTGSENAAGIHNVSVHDLNCRDSPRGILLKDDVPKSNMNFSSISMSDINSTATGPGGVGEAFSILAVDTIRVADVAGAGVQAAGSLSSVANANFSNVTITGPPDGSGHGWHCKSNVTGVRAVGTVSPPLCHTVWGSRAHLPRKSASPRSREATSPVV